MKIRTRLVLRFTIVVASILILFACTIYYLSASYRKQEFYTRLKDKATTIAKLYSKDVEEVSPQLLKIIEKNCLNLLPDEKIAIYDYKNVLLFDSPGNNDTVMSTDLVNEIRLQKEIRFTEGENEVIGILFEGQFDRYVVIASAFDQYGYSKLRFLKYTLSIGFIATILIIIIAGFFFSKQALFPISKVVDEVDEITVSNLNKRVDIGNGTDEIAQLAVTFNRMLDRIEKHLNYKKISFLMPHTN